MNQTVAPVPVLLRPTGLTSKNFMPGLTIAAIAAAEGHIDSSCSSLKDGPPAQRHTSIKLFELFQNDIKDEAN